MVKPKNISIKQEDAYLYEKAANEFGSLSNAIRSLLKERYQGKLKSESEEEDYGERGPIPVYDDEEIIAQVAYNDELDVWNGRNWQNGGTGYHRGITKLSNGSYVLIHGSDWQGSRDYATVISANQALQEIMAAQKEELLEEDKFAPLKALRNEKLIKEA